VAAAAAEEEPTISCKTIMGWQSAQNLKVLAMLFEGGWLLHLQAYVTPP
jgi:hypothetical protein